MGILSGYQCLNGKNYHLLHSGVGCYPCSKRGGDVFAGVGVVVCSGQILGLDAGGHLALVVGVVPVGVGCGVVVGGRYVGVYPAAGRKKMEQRKRDQLNKGRERMGLPPLKD